jgi:hypothetical protein
VNAVDKYGRTSLKVAAKNGFQSVVKVLLKVNAVTESGETSLTVAAKNCYQSVVKVLLT